MTKIIHDENLTATYAYLDNVSVTGSDIKDHNSNLERLQKCIKKYNFTYNEDACEFGVAKLSVLGAVIENNEIRIVKFRTKSNRKYHFGTGSNRFLTFLWR